MRGVVADPADDVTGKVTRNIAAVGDALEHGLVRFQA